MFSTRKFIEQETARINYLDFVDQNVTGLAGRLRPMPREIENRIIYQINNNFRRAFLHSLANIINDIFEQFRTDSQVQKSVNHVDEFFTENGLGEYLLGYYHSRHINAFSFSQWFYDVYLTHMQERILGVSSRLSGETANSLNEISDHPDLNELILTEDDFGPDGLPKRSREVKVKQEKLAKFLRREYNQIIDEKIRDIVERSGQFFADPVLEAIETLVGMKSTLRERLVRVIENRHDEKMNISGLSIGLNKGPETSHFEDLEVIVIKALGVSEHLKNELSKDKGQEIQNELHQFAGAADMISRAIEKEAGEFNTAIEHWS